jgi:hypothetical protein
MKRLAGRLRGTLTHRRHAWELKASDGNVSPRRQGRIAYKKIGPVGSEIWENELLPQLLELRKGTAS